MPSLPPAATRGRKLAHSRSLVYSTKCIRVLPCASVGIIAIVVVEPACECRTTFSGSLGLALFLHLWAHKSTGLVRGQARGKCIKNGSSLGGGDQAVLLAWGHFLILKFWNFCWPLVLRLAASLWGQVDPAFPVEKLPPSPCLSLYVWLGVCVSLFLSVCLSVPAILCGSLCIFLSHICGRRRSSCLSAFPWICVCLPPPLIPIAISLSLFCGYFCLSHPPLMPRIAGFPDASDDKESACNVGDPGS